MTSHRQILVIATLADGSTKSLTLELENSEIPPELSAPSDSVRGLDWQLFLGPGQNPECDIQRYYVEGRLPQK